MGNQGWPGEDLPKQDEDAGSGFGATGVFQVRSGAVQPPAPAPPPPGPVASIPVASSPVVPGRPAAPRADQPFGSGNAMSGVPVQPLVHTVIFPTLKAEPVDEGARLRQMLRDQAAAAAAPPLAAAPAPAVPPAASNPAQTYPAAARPAAPAQPVPAGGFTQLLRTLEHRPGLETPTPAASTVVSMATPPVAPVAPSSPAPAEGGSGGFTSLFNALGSAAPANPAPLASPANANPAYEPAARVESPASQPAAVRQQQLYSGPRPASAIPVTAARPQVGNLPGQGSGPASNQAPPSAVPAPAPATPPVAAAPPRAVAPEPVVVPRPAPDPGSFTQLMQVLGTTGTVAKQTPAPAPPARPEPAAVAPPPAMQERFVPALPPMAHPPMPPAPPAVPPPVVGATPPASSFTQLMQVLDTSTGTQNQVRAQQPAAPPHPLPPQAGRDLSFTDLSLGRVNADWSASQPLGKSDPVSSRESAPPRSESWPAPANPQSYPPANYPAARNEFGEGSGYRSSSLEPVALQPPAPPQPAGGGLTQLLRALDRPAEPAKPSMLQPSLQDEFKPAASAGIFTQTYGQLSDPVAASAPAAPQQAPFQPSLPMDASATSSFQQPMPRAGSMPPVNQGPSEFTRILNASQLREAGLHGGSGAPPVSGQTPPAAQAGGMPGFQAPPMPPMPGMAPPQFAPPQFAPPHFPPPQAGAQAHPQMPPAYHPQMPPPPPMQMPAAPPVPAITPPAAKPQSFLPLILIGVIFVLVIVIVALVFIMKR